MTSLDYLIDIEYDNLTLDKLVNIKQSLTETLEKFEDFAYDYSKQNAYLSLFEITLNLTNLSEAAYGKLDNPMKDYLKNVREGVAILKAYDNKLTSYWILDHLQFIGTKQTFNLNNITSDVQSSTEKLIKLNETVQAISGMLSVSPDEKGHKTALKMYKKALRKKLEYNETLFVTNQKFEFVTVDVEKIKIKTYSFENFQMIRTDDVIATKAGTEGVYRKAIKKVFPEWYL